jgi:type IV pilus assembly protein PilP
MKRSYIAASIVSLLFAGCANTEHSDLKEFVAQSEQGLRGRVEALPLVASQEAMTYSAAELPDPFRPSSAKPSLALRTAGDWRPPEPREMLEAYPLDALKMVGTMERKGTRWALIKTPDSTVHRVTVGNRIGQNFGAIAMVADTGVTLQEHVEDGSGWSERTASLQLQDESQRN